MQDLAIRGGPWTSEEREALLAYCESDVLALAKLLPAMEPELDLSRAVACRGRYMGAVARMEWAGVPIDVRDPLPAPGRLGVDSRSAHSRG